MTDVPHRRVRLVIDLEADTVREMQHALQNVIDGLDQRASYDDPERGPVWRPTEWTSGGYASGHHVNLTIDPTQDHDTYRQQLDEWIAQRKAERVEVSP